MCCKPVDLLIILVTKFLSAITSLTQKLAFHLPHVRILGTIHCGAMQRTAFKRRELFQDILCLRDYAERVVAIFSNKIKS